MSEDLRKALEDLLPGKVAGESWDLPDTDKVAITTTFGAIRRARAALTSSQDGWRAIEEAEQAINNEILGLGVYMGKAVRFVCVWNGAEWYAGWGNAIQPTLWMPLPPPPVKDMGL